MGHAMKRPILLILLFLALLSGCAPTGVYREEPPKPLPHTPTLQEREKLFIEGFRGLKLPFVIPAETRVDTLHIDTLNQTILIGLSDRFAGVPFREESVKGVYDSVKKYFGKEFNSYRFNIETMHQPLEQLIPNYFRTDTSRYDRTRLAGAAVERGAPVVRNVSKALTPTEGLYNRNVVVWPSHGWYYNNETDRWEWQRPRLFQSVEDLIPMSFVLPYLVPMLENASANVFVPRERDTQTNEVIVDNDSPVVKGVRVYRQAVMKKHRTWRKGNRAGYAYGNPPYQGNFNPFVAGTDRMILSDTVASASASWVPRIPETGWYAVYVTYVASDESASDASYTVFHAGGKTEFSVNQRIGGGTWVYLGEFKFRAGIHLESGKVLLTNKSREPGRIISADAVRFGGGMGMIARNGHTGGRPKYVEGSRYYLQYLGMPDSLVYNLTHDKSDYRDDYQSRPEYVNYLNGAPAGPNKDRNAPGLRIPIDVSLAFHTDAGITHNDTTIGTLAIYSVEDADSQFVFPGGMSRMANRDLADIVQTQVVQDIRNTYDPAWTRRDLRDSKYSEAFRPNVPALLLELLSHQNFLDMKYVLDPQFRFHVARSIYKGILKFIATQNGMRFAVQPLPVTHFSTSFSGPAEVTLRWKPAIDSLEPTAVPDRFFVYTRTDDGGFDNGQLADQPMMVIKNLKPGIIYSYYVTAANAGGESFPSEILSVCRAKKEKGLVLIVNGFDRLSAPAAVETPTFSGFLNAIDPGVADRVNLNFTGLQYDFSPGSRFRTNDGPGHGASSADQEGKLTAGNSFDYPFVHGVSLRNAGCSFVSSSAIVLEDTMVALSAYTMVDLILGEQRQTHWQKRIVDSLRGTRYSTFPRALREAIGRYCDSGGNVFVSGAYIGTDLFTHQPVDSSRVAFAEKTLKFTWITDHGTATGKVNAIANSFLPEGTSMEFMTEPNKEVYAVKAPDAIGPIGGSKLALRYSENQFGAATAFKDKYGAVVFGFPFETIATQQWRNVVMEGVLKFFRVK